MTIEDRPRTPEIGPLGRGPDSQFPVTGMQPSAWLNSGSGRRRSLNELAQATSATDERPGSVFDLPPLPDEGAGVTAPGAHALAEPPLLVPHTRPVPSSERTIRPVLATPTRAQVVGADPLLDGLQPQELRGSTSGAGLVSDVLRPRPHLVDLPLSDAVICPHHGPASDPRPSCQTRRANAITRPGNNAVQNGGADPTT